MRRRVHTLSGSVKNMMFLCGNKKKGINKSLLLQKINIFKVDFQILVSKCHIAKAFGPYGQH